MKLLLLGRPGCHLCEEFEQELLACFGAGVFEIEHADVDSRPEWRRRYGLKIPVALDQRGEVLCETRFDSESLENCLRDSK